MKRILVPVDFSEQSINAFRFALDLAWQSGGTISLLHVLTLPVIHDSGLMPVAGFSKTFLDELKDEANNKLNNIIAEFNSERIPIDTGIVISERIHATLIDAIKEDKIDLVVMGTRGASGFREWAIGSNTEKMVRNAPVPVLAVKQYTPAQNIKDIVFPNALDTTNQEGLLMRIKALQDFFQATLHIIWVNTPALSQPDDEIRQKLSAFAKRFMLQNFTINVFNHTNEESGILEFANLIDADLIAMGTHGLTGVAHLISGSVAEDVVNHVPYPVWTYCTKSKKTNLSTSQN